MDGLTFLRQGFQAVLELSIDKLALNWGLPTSAPECWDQKCASPPSSSLYFYVWYFGSYHPTRKVKVLKTPVPGSCVWNVGWEWSVKATSDRVWVKLHLIKICARGKWRVLLRSVQMAGSQTLKLEYKGSQKWVKVKIVFDKVEGLKLLLRQKMQG